MSFLEPGQNNLPGQSLGDPLNIFGNNTPGGSGKWDKPVAPTPPDYGQLIKDQAQANQINQNTPNGSLQFSTDKNGNTTANMAYSPQMQAYANQLGSLQKQYGQQAGPFQAQDNSAAVNADTQNSYNQAMALMQPQLTQQQNQLTQNMADRGLPVGSEIQQNAQQQFGQYEGGLENQAAYNAIGQGQSLENQMYGQQLGAYQANMGGLGEIGQLQGNLPGLNSFYSPTSSNTLGAEQLAMNGQQQNYAQMMQQYGSNMGGLFSLGAAIL